MLSAVRNFCVSLTTIFILSSCQTVNVRGQYIDDETIKHLQNSNLDKGAVLQVLGTPTIVPDYSDNIWYYAERSVATKAWSNPKVVEQRIVKVTFNKEDQVENVLVLEGADTESMKVIKDYTKTGGTNRSGFQKFFGNIGKFGRSKDRPKRQ